MTLSEVIKKNKEEKDFSFDLDLDKKKITDEICQTIR